MEMLRREVTNLILDGLVEKVDDEKIDSLLMLPKIPSMGDLTLPCFTLAKDQCMSPVELARFLANHLDSTLISKTEVAGGYLNIFINRASYSNTLIPSIIKEGVNYGTGTWGQNKTLVIDFSSPNIAKPFSMGHLRSTVIGHSLARLGEKVGFKVKRLNHIGDWGTQFGKLMAAYKLWGNKEAVEADPIPELLKLYVRFHEEAKDNPELETAGRQWFKKLEDHDPEAKMLWTWFREASLLAFNKTYALLGVVFDSTDGEAFYNDKMAPVVAQLKAGEHLVESDGAYIVPLGENLSPCLIQKSDGTSLYATRDLAAAIYRKEHYHFDEAFYVVGHEQTIHFQQVFAVLEIMGFGWSNQLSHVDFGMMLKNGKKMSTRKGEIVRLDDALEQVISKALENIRVKNPALTNKETVAQMVGVGALIFNDLKHNPSHDIEFSFEDMLSFEGETGPYLQYTHVRTCSLLRKGAGKLKESKPLHFDNHNTEWALILKLSQFGEIIKHAFEDHNPSKLARYLLKLAQQFNKYYAQARILEENEGLDARLALVEAIQTVLKEGLWLLGIEAPEQM